MPQFFLEILSEEIPARMQAKAEADLLMAIERALKEAGLSYGKAQSFSGPRRLAVAIDDIPEKSADIKEERKGPRVGAPDKAIEGFLRGAGLSSIQEATIQSDPKKGDFYVAVIEKAGTATPDILLKAIPQILKDFHWPKSMRTASGDFRWVRPIQKLVCLFDGEIIPIEIDGLMASNETEGHRIMGRGPFKVTGLADWQSQLEGEGFVNTTRAERLDIIAKGAHEVCKSAGLEWIEDKGLLEEVAGLAEWPVVLLGEMDPGFLDLPPEVITLSMKSHQKYFAVRDPKANKLAPNFVVIANLEAEDRGKKIAAGNARVLSARLADARFFWDEDNKKSLEDNWGKLASVTYHEKLGSVQDKASRVKKLVEDLAPICGADKGLATRAAHLAKCDLVTNMVIEFTDLQGLMGGYYAKAQGEDDAIVKAITDHYKPKGPSDSVPGEPTSITLALADKLDTLTGFWSIDEKPTGSKDPYALRRAALGVIRLILENDLRLELKPFFACLSEEQGGDLLAFFADRLKVHLRDQGKRHDLIDAVFALGEDDLWLITKRVEALSEFLKSDDGTNLLAGYKRAANILKAEAKKGFDVNAGLEDLGSDDTMAALEPALKDEAERQLHKTLSEMAVTAKDALKREDFSAAMTAMASLRAPVDRFFDEVTVNAEDEALRRNRLLLLHQVTATIDKVADFSKIEG